MTMRPPRLCSTRLRLVGVATTLFVIAATGAADGAPRAWLATVEVAGLEEADAARARLRVERALVDAGFEVVVASSVEKAALRACRGDARCASGVGRAAGAHWVVRTSLVLAGETLVVAMELTSALNAERSLVTVRLPAESGRDPVLVAALRKVGRGGAPPRARRAAGWSLVAVGALLAAGGVLAWRERDAAVHEFEHHLQGDEVVGLTPAEAAELEDRASRWGWLGGAALAGSALSLSGGALLLLWPTGDEAPGALASVRGTF